MKRHAFPTAAALALAIALPASRARAAGFDTSVVPADAGWLIHVDVEALEASRAGAALFASSGWREAVDEAQREIGLDLRHDVASVTAYGGGGMAAAAGAVIVALTSDRIEAALTRLREGGEVAVETAVVQGNEVHTISGPDGPLHVHLRPVTRADRRLVLMSGDRGALARAIAVVDGAVPALPREAAPTAHRGSFALAAASCIEDLPAPAAGSPIARLAEAAVVDAGEADGEVYAAATVATATGTDARDAAQVILGLTALGRLIAADEPDLAPLASLASAIAVATEGRRVTISVHFDVALLEEALGAEVQRDPR
jgi:hypothetical protein